MLHNKGLSDDAKEKLYADLILHTSKVDEKEVIMLGGDMNGHVGKVMRMSMVALDMELEMLRVSASWSWVSP